MACSEEPWRLGRERRDHIITEQSLATFYGSMDVMAEPLRAEGPFLLNTQLSRITSENRHDVVNWGRPVGREV